MENLTFNSLENIICVLKELIHIRDGCKKCNGLNNNALY